MIVQHMCTQSYPIYMVRGQSYKDFYTLRQIYKHILKHKNNVLTQHILYPSIGALHLKIFIGLHFSLRLD